MFPMDEATVWRIQRGGTYSGSVESKAPAAHAKPRKSSFGLSKLKSKKEGTSRQGKKKAAPPSPTLSLEDHSFPWTPSGTFIGSDDITTRTENAMEYLAMSDVGQLGYVLLIFRSDCLDTLLITAADLLEKTPLASWRCV